jgi:hypothetical protein
VAGFCGHANEPSGSIKSGEFLDCLSDSAPWMVSVMLQLYRDRFYINK